MRTTLLAAMALAATLPSVYAATITLAEYAFNIDGFVSNGSAPLGVDISGFDTGTGLGTITVTMDGPGAHFGLLFLDHEIDEDSNTFFDEIGTLSGVPSAGQSWEIDEPGYGFGDIYDNFVAGTLDHSNGVPSTAPDDVSMALGWDFSLAAGETALLRLDVGEAPPASGFYLMQSDAGGNVYFSSSLNVSGVPDGGSTLALLLCACGGLVGWRSTRKA